MRRFNIAAFLLAALVVFYAACGSEVESVPDPPAATPEPATQTPFVVIEVTPTPWPPFNPTPYPNDGQMMTRLDSWCDLGPHGPQLNIVYRAEILAGTAEISRVQILLDGMITEDSGFIGNQVFAREVTYRGGSSRLYQVEFRVLVRGNDFPRSSLTLVRCPRVPTLPAY